MSNELAEEVKTFFQKYCAGFEALDVEAIADCVAYPCHIASAGDEISLIEIANRQACLAAMSRVVELHRQLGAPSGRIEDLSILTLSPRLVQASLTMKVLDGTSRLLYDFQASYSLAIVSGAWRIVAIAHNQIPRLLRCIAEPSTERGMIGNFSLPICNGSPRSEAGQKKLPFRPRTALTTP